MTPGEYMDNVTIQAIGGVLLLILTPILSYAGNRISAVKGAQAEEAKARAALRQEEVKTAGPDWLAFTTEIKAWTREQIAQRDEEHARERERDRRERNQRDEEHARERDQDRRTMASMRKEIDDLRKKVTQANELAQTVSAKLAAALAYIRLWLDRHPDDELASQQPAELLADLR